MGKLRISNWTFVFLGVFGFMVVVSLPSILRPPLPITITLLTLFVVSFFVFSFLHGLQTLGGRAVSVFLVITVVVTFSMEWLGTHFGVPFGHYFYTNRLGPLLLDVPLVIPMQWFNMLYVSYVMVQIINSQGASTLGPRISGDAEPSKFRQSFPKMVTGAFLAGLFMVAWDFINDPYMVGVGAWVWTNPGEFGGLMYYGIPLSNYLGWLFTSSLTIFLFELYRWRWHVDMQWVNQDVGDPATILVLGPYLFVLTIQAMNGITFGIFSGSPTAYGPIIFASATMGLAVIAALLHYRLIRQK